MLPILALVLLPVPADTDPPPGAVDPSAVTRAAVAVAEVGGELIGFGRDYDVVFEDGGATFRPVDLAGGSRSLSLGLESISIAGETFYEAPDGRAPSASNDPVAPVVRYGVGAFGEERYTLHERSLKHDVVLERLPEGARGDLVVRMRARAWDGAAATDDGSGGLAFVEQYGPGVVVGQVVGIDADGRRALGTSRLDGETLELRLPEAFVAKAALPLVVDPMISSHWIYDGGYFGEVRGVDVAMADKVSPSRSVIVWERWTGSKSLVLFTAVDAFGAQRMPVDVLAVHPGEAPLAAGPAVTAVTKDDRCIAAWATSEAGSDRIHYSVLQADPAGAEWSAVAAASDDPGGDVLHLDIGGHRNIHHLYESEEAEPGVYALCVYGNSDGDVRGQYVWLDAESGFFGVLHETWIDEDGEGLDARPSVGQARDPGHEPTWVVAWERHDPSGDVRVRARAVGALLLPMSEIVEVFGDPSRPCRAPAVGGSTFCVIAGLCEGEEVRQVVARHLRFVSHPGGGIELRSSTWEQELDAQPLYRALAAPDVGMASVPGLNQACAVVWGRETSTWELVGATFDVAPSGLLYWCEPVFWIADSAVPPTPRITDCFSVAGARPVCVWAGDSPAWPDVTARGAILDMCP